MTNHGGNTQHEVITTRARIALALQCMRAHARLSGLLALVALAPLGMGARGCDHAVVGSDCGKKGAPACACEYNGQGYLAGDTFPDADGCNTCSCEKDGSVPCTLKLCDGGGAGNGGSGKVCGGLQGASCADDEYCNFPPDAICGAADGTGTCASKPDNCAEIYKPVCGCDDKTYGNACEAASAGVSVVSGGECGSSGGGGGVCGGLQGLSCPDDQYCAFKSDAFCGAADQTGNCLPKPEMCPGNVDPVCGCDDKTYNNDCEAAMNGVSVASQGECGSSGGGDGCDYEGKHYAEGEGFPSSDGCNTCSCKGGDVICTLIGCGDPNGTVCGGLTGESCPDGQYCLFQPEAQCGAADQTGTCEDVPGDCTKEFVPVCGCDDKTYGNACEAAAAGVSIISKGECGSSGGGVCNYNGKDYAEGDSFPDADGCNTCTCTAGGQIACTLKACAPGKTCGGLLGEGCDGGQYCDFPIETMCGSGDQQGECKPIPQVCDLVYAPVCGCDGKTYGNDCQAASAGTSVVSEGECK